MPICATEASIPSACGRKYSQRVRQAAPARPLPAARASRAVGCVCGRCHARRLVRNGCRRHAREGPSPAPRHGHGHVPRHRQTTSLDIALTRGEQHEAEGGAHEGSDTLQGQQQQGQQGRTRAPSWRASAGTVVKILARRRVRSTGTRLSIPPAPDPPVAVHTSCAADDVDEHATCRTCRAVPKRIQLCSCCSIRRPARRLPHLPTVRVSSSRGSGARTCEEDPSRAHRSCTPKPEPPAIQPSRSRPTPR